MRTQRFLVYLLFLSSVTILLSCTKTTKPQIVDEPLVTTEIANGLPSDPKKIHGYFYTCNKNSVSGGNNKNMYLFATFGDPFRNLMLNYDHVRNTSRSSGNIVDQANVSVGSVTYNGMDISFSGSTTYQYFGSVGFLDPSSHWITAGNGSFKPLDVTVPRGFPAINVSSSFSISLSQDFTLDLSKYMSNYDSASVLLSYYTSSSSYVLKKSISSDASPVVVFKQTELSNALSSTQYGGIIFKGYNYSNKTIENRVYVFELSNEIDANLVITN